MTPVSLSPRNSFAFPKHHPIVDRPSHANSRDTYAACRTNSLELQQIPFSAGSSCNYAVSSLDLAQEPIVNGIVALLIFGIS